MKMIPLALAAALLAGAASADTDTFSGGMMAGSLAASGFVSMGQPGRWSVGAMNESWGFAGVTETHTGVEISTSGGSRSEGFGQNFRGFTGAAGVGGGFGASRFRGRF